MKSKLTYDSNLETKTIGIDSSCALFEVDGFLFRKIISQRQFSRYYILAYITIEIINAKTCYSLLHIFGAPVLLDRNSWPPHMLSAMGIAFREE